MQLVEMLADLAEDNEIETNVDNDSILGSQYSTFSEVIENNQEEEEIEDLNITSLDLDSLSSWESVYKRTNQHGNVIEAAHNEDNHESSDNVNVTEQSCKDITLMDFAQFDGANDLYENVLECEEKVINYSNNKDNTRCSNIIHNQSKNIKFAVPVIRTAKNYIKCNLHRNLRSTDFIEYIVNNPNTYLKEQLYNFVNRCYFHIFIKTSKYLQVLNINSTNINTNTVRKKRLLQNNKRRIIAYNEKMKRKLRMIQYQLLSDHQNLDVYDIDEVESSETFEDINQYYISNYEGNKSIWRQDPTLHFQHGGFFNNYHDLQQNRFNSSMKFILLSVDGAAATDSSDSEPDMDVTIDVEEKRICTYKSCEKNAPQSMAQCTPRKRMFDFNDDYKSSGKRRNIGVSRSPKCSSRKYSPLNITITSPKTSKSPVRQYESPKRIHCTSNVPSTSTTPKRKIYPLRMSVLREKCITEGNLINIIHKIYKCKRNILEALLICFFLNNVLYLLLFIFVYKISLFSREYWH